MTACALCKSNKPLVESHIIPQFVFDRIKKNSPTGFLRAALLKPNKREQDGDKHKMLCADCEQRFSKAEKDFAEKVFEPYHESGITSFAYGPWLSYFISSVNWRTLHLDNIGFHSEKKLADETLRVLDDAEKMLADFLLGKRADIGDMESHILPMFEVTDANSLPREPNLYIRVSAFGYTFVDLANNGFYVFANLAGVLIFTVIRKGRKDVWKNTLVQPDGGSIKQLPVRVSSPLVFDMIQHLEELERSHTTISQAQRNKIIESLKANPQVAQAKAVQFRKLDEKLRR
ncbi:MAG: hypothetical protein WC476_05650 [Phycisphaerae bacterium]